MYDQAGPGLWPYCGRVRRLTNVIRYAPQNLPSENELRTSQLPKSPPSVSSVVAAPAAAPTPKKTTPKKTSAHHQHGVSPHGSERHIAVH